MEFNEPYGKLLLDVNHIKIKDLELYSLTEIAKRLQETANIIDGKFSKVNEENRIEISSDILSHVRHFCEAFMYKVYDEENDADLYQTQSNLTIIKNILRITIMTYGNSMFCWIPASCIWISVRCRRKQ